MRTSLRYAVSGTLFLALLVLLMDAFVIKGQLHDDWWLGTPPTIHVGTAPVSEDLVYTIVAVDTERYELVLTNNSFRPYYFWCYAFSDWAYRLPTEEVFRYASRPRIYLGDFTVIDESGGGFDCGSGLGLTKIAPYQTFRLSVPVTYFNNLLRLKRGTTVLPEVLGEYDSERFSADFTLQVVSYTGNTPYSVVSNIVDFELDALRSTP